MSIVNDVQDGRDCDLVEDRDSQEDIGELNKFGKVPTWNVVDIAPSAVYISDAESKVLSWDPLTRHTTLRGPPRTCCALH